MNKLIIATTTALGFACVGGASFAQDQSQPTNMQDVVVAGVRAPYEIYVANLRTGYQLQALVGNTHERYLQAQRAADRSESLRTRGLAVQPLVSVAIDNSSGAGVARQFQLINAANETVAIVDVYCKRSVPSGGPHCLLAPRLMGTGGSSERVAFSQAGQLQIAAVDRRH